MCELMMVGKWRRLDPVVERKKRQTRKKCTHVSAFNKLVMIVYENVLTRRLFIEHDVCVYKMQLCNATYASCIKIAKVVVCMKEYCSRFDFFPLPSLIDGFRRTRRAVLFNIHEYERRETSRENNCLGIY